MRHVIETRVTQYNTVDVRRNSALTVESLDETMANTTEVNDEDVKDVHNLKASNPYDLNSARSSMSSVPPSATSDRTLFEDFEAGLESGPQAESTPHNSVTQKPKSRHPPPPLPDIHRETRAPSIRYIKSDEQESIVMDKLSEEASPIAPHWSTKNRTVVPKASKLQRKPSDGKENGGLRQLTLLGNANVNTQSERNSPSAAVRPLMLGKKQKSRTKPSVQDENAAPIPPPKKNKNLKELSLVRSETAKARGRLRQNEVLPEVVVRPPSLTDYQEFVYSFRD